MKKTFLAVPLLGIIPATLDAATITILETQVTTFVGDRRIVETSPTSRTDVQNTNSESSGEAFTDINSGTIGARVEVSSPSDGLTLDAGGSFRFQVETDPGAVLPAGLFELVVTGNIQDDVPLIPFASAQTIVTAGIGTTITVDGIGGNAVQAIEVNAVGEEVVAPGVASPVRVAGFEVVVGDASQVTFEDNGDFTAILTTDEFSFVPPIINPIFPPFPNFIEVGFSISSFASPGAFALAEFSNTAELRINDTLGVSVIGAPEGLLISNQITGPQPTPVPLPATGSILLFALSSIFFLKRRKVKLSC